MLSVETKSMFKFSLKVKKEFFFIVLMVSAVESGAIYPGTDDL